MSALKQTIKPMDMTLILLLSLMTS